MTKKPESKYRPPKYDPDDPKQFPSRLRECIEANGYTTKTFAQAAGFTESAVYNYLTGDNGMKIEDLVKTANLLGTTVDYLVGREDVHLPDPELRAMSEYLGLSQESIEMLKLLHNGREVQIDYETLEDCQENAKLQASVDDDVDLQFSTHSMEIQITPNKKAMRTINALLEFDFENVPRDDTLEPQDDHLPYDSVFNLIYAMLFPQEGNPDDPKYAEYKADTMFREDISELRLRINPEYGRDGRDYIAKQEHDRFMIEFLKEREELQNRS